MRSPQNPDEPHEGRGSPTDDPQLDEREHLGAGTYDPGDPRSGDADESDDAAVTPEPKGRPEA